MTDLSPADRPVVLLCGGARDARARAAGQLASAGWRVAVVGVDQGWLRDQQQRAAVEVAITARRGDETAAEVAVCILIDRLGRLDAVVHLAPTPGAAADGPSSRAATARPELGLAPTVDGPALPHLAARGGALLYGLPVAGSVERRAIDALRAARVDEAQAAGLSVRIEGSADPVARLLTGPTGATARRRDRVLGLARRVARRARARLGGRNAASEAAPSR